MIINVTQQHIDKGIPRSACECPVALAINEAIGNGYSSVSPIAIYIWPNNVFGEDEKRYTTPIEVAYFIHWFDANGHPTPKPFSFELEIK